MRILHHLTPRHSHPHPESLTPWAPLSPSVCHPYCVFADNSSENWYATCNDGIKSRPPCRGITGRVQAEGCLKLGPHIPQRSCSQIPLEQSTISQNFEYSPTFSRV
ncbi:hypothetical protein SLA2020_064070 [Shorea laevis]